MIDVVSYVALRYIHAAMDITMQRTNRKDSGRKKKKSICINWGKGEEATPSSIYHKLIIFQGRLGRITSMSSSFDVLFFEMKREKC